ncbi:hypothetical protein TNCV_3719051 [Trichonephila clavipes]|nr:hypothetical protein TNCV_3719051 [Trichonephila clavipes]
MWKERIYITKLSGATAHEGQGPSVPISVFVTGAVGVHVRMFRSSGQSDAKPPVISSQAGLVLIYRPTKRNERLSRPCPLRNLNAGLLAWKHDTLPLSHRALREYIYVT